MVAVSCLAQGTFLQHDSRLPPPSYLSCNHLHLPPQHQAYLYWERITNAKIRNEVRERRTRVRVVRTYWIQTLRESQKNK